jgi:hypothetical protein
MGWVMLGAVLYKKGKVRVLYRKLQPNTTTHNNQYEPQLPYPPTALPNPLYGEEQWHHQIMAPPLPDTIRRRQAVGLALAVVGLLAWGGKMRGINKYREGGLPYIIKQQSNRRRCRS